METWLVGSHRSHRVTPSPARSDSSSAEPGSREGSVPGLPQHTPLGSPKPGGSLKLLPSHRRSCSRWGSASQSRPPITTGFADLCTSFLETPEAFEAGTRQGA